MIFGRRSHSGWVRAFPYCLGAVALVACAGRGVPPASHPAGPAPKTIVIGSSRIDPNDLTIGTADAIGFRSTAGDPLQVEFIQPDVQTGRITCRVMDPALLQRGEQPWAEFRPNTAGHLTAYVPPGAFPSTCTFTPGRYTYRVRVLDAQMRPLEEKLGQLGWITVK
jgi:hypothetical protein